MKNEQIKERIEKDISRSVKDVADCMLDDGDFIVAVGSFDNGEVVATTHEGFELHFSADEPITSEVSEYIKRNAVDAKHFTDVIFY